MAGVVKVQVTYRLFNKERSKKKLIVADVRKRWSGGGSTPCPQPIISLKSKGAKYIYKFGRVCFVMIYDSLLQM